MQDSNKEAKEALNQLLNYKDKLEYVATEIMKQLDFDGSGKLEFPEVKKMIDDFTRGAAQDKRPTENEIREAFDKLDKDSSGCLELDELVPLVKGIIQDMVKQL